MLLDPKGLPVREWKIDDQALEVGRAFDSDISVDDPRMSRRHFRIERVNEAVWITDLESKTGISINGKSRESAVLKSGDMIEAGDTTFFYESGIETLLVETEKKTHHTTIGKVIQDLRIPNSKPEIRKGNRS